MTLIMPPEPGEDVSVLAPNVARLEGRVTGRVHEGLTIELKPTPIRRPFRFAAGLEVTVEWVNSHGAMQLPATVDEAKAEPPMLRLRLVGAPERLERRAHPRAPDQLEVTAWTTALPSRQLVGNTVNLSVDGALLWLPDLPRLATTVELDIALPGKAVHVSARVIRRAEAGLVGVQFEQIGAEQRAWLSDFARGPR